MTKISETVATKMLGLSVIRTLGLYQPFATLMLPPHDKIETRWVPVGKKPPFPLGWYMIYSTKKRYDWQEVKNLSGSYWEALRLEMKHEKELKLANPGNLLYDRIDDLQGYAIGFGQLIEVRPWTPLTSPQTFIDVDPYQCDEHDMNGVPKQWQPNVVIDGYGLWNLVFDKMYRVNPFPFRGKQGVGILTFEERQRLQVWDPEKMR